MATESENVEERVTLDTDHIDQNNPSNCTVGLRGSCAIDPVKRFSICDQWDLIIQLNTICDLEADYLVSRAALALASPVFAKMVDAESPFPSIKERKQSDGTVCKHLDIFDDDPDALLVLLRAIHLKFDMVPTGQLAFTKLLALTKLVDKYDCARIILPWQNCWIGDLYQQQVLTAGHESWLYICVVLGESRNFTELTKLLITQFLANENAVDDGEIQQRRNVSVSIQDIPDKIFGTAVHSPKILC